MSGVFIFHKTTKVTRGKNFAALCLRKLSLAVHKIECPIYFYRSLMCQFLENANIKTHFYFLPPDWLSLHSFVTLGAEGKGEALCPRS